MPATQVKPYQTVVYNLQLDGISSEQLEEHYKLYGGYVTNTNTLNEKMAELVEAGKFSTPEYNEIRRRFGFEYDGMRLHEYYFGALKSGGAALPSGSKLYKKIEEDFGSYANWEADFKASGMIRGIGWVILYQDPQTKRLQNFWIGDHEYGHPAGFTPILVMDVWEHAYSVDYKPTGRKAYIDAYFKNIDWPTVEARLQ